MPPVLESLASTTSASGSTMATATASGCPFCRARSAAFLARLARISVAQVVQLPVPAADHLTDVTHPRRLPEDDVAASQRHQGRHAHRAVVDIGDGLHVLDRRDHVGQVVADGLDAARAVDLQERAGCSFPGAPARCFGSGRTP